MIYSAATMPIRTSPSRILVVGATGGNGASAAVRSSLPLASRVAATPARRHSRASVPPGVLGWACPCRDWLDYHASEMRDNPVPRGACGIITPLRREIFHGTHLCRSRRSTPRAPTSAQRASWSPDPRVTSIRPTRRTHWYVRHASASRHLYPRATVLRELGALGPLPDGRLFLAGRRNRARAASLELVQNEAPAHPSTAPR